LEGREIQKERVEAMNLLGELCELGQGTSEGEPDIKEALIWYKRAMQFGHARATFNLASLYEQGAPGVVERNMEKAIRLYEEASRRGNLEAQDRFEELKELDLIS
jgi:TPR repeat protein